jgi:3-phosphoshikimate 1-carboxyvinyltransferase
MIQTLSSRKLRGKITVPASKSDAQRAILAAALANGTSKVIGVGESDDVKAMLQAIEQLGAMVTIQDDCVIIQGIAVLESEKSVFIGESGLGARLLIATASTFKHPITIDGTGSLLQRPISFYDKTLPALGVSIKSTSGFLPVTVKGPLIGGKIAVDGAESSQTISGLLMALPLSKEDSLLSVQSFTSKPYVQMTIRTLAAFGIAHHAENVFAIKGCQSYQPTRYEVELDWSAASFWLVAAAIGHSVAIVGLNDESLQADKALLRVFEAAQIDYSWQENTIQVNGENKTAFEFDATDCPDLFPALVVLATCCNGTSIIKGVNRLIHKESNRSEALQQEFSKLGITITVFGDEMHVTGTNTIIGAVVSAHNDHRIAMALAILATRSDEVIEIHQAAAVSKSYPQFWDHLQKLTI